MRKTDNLGGTIMDMTRIGAFHSINEAVGDMVEHLADTFDSNAAFLKGCIIKDGTSVILVGIHLIFIIIESALCA